MTVSRREILDRIAEAFGRNAFRISRADGRYSAILEDGRGNPSGYGEAVELIDALDDARRNAREQGEES